ncbi:hypothetical protein KIN20_032658 [Parelaphostrongylus tenuis]|uniref:Uncharacterized protein n=1 Tax=Parelaphostrongylus tenuis TaxID=148309 RepID=A0AAD5R990_PARTN|nr:hypothetical protein KIN20_032658 [Parelaphostrongylus tenuis]
MAANVLKSFWGKTELSEFRDAVTLSTTTTAGGGQSNFGYKPSMTVQKATTSHLTKDLFDVAAREFKISRKTAEATPIKTNLIINNFLAQLLMNAQCTSALRNFVMKKHFNNA